MLNGYEIADKKLMVKVDQKTKELLGEIIRRNKAEKAQVTNAKKASMLRNVRGIIIRYVLILIRDFLVHARLDFQDNNLNYF